MENLKLFIYRRKCSAIAISTNYQEKGDSSILTKKHFETKLLIYNKASKNFDKNEMLKNYYALLSELNSTKVEEMDPMDFQIIIAKIEAIGELIIKHETTRLTLET